MNSGSQDESVYRAPAGPTVQEMFAEIATRYDLLNRVLSLSVDRYWRHCTVQLMRSMKPEAGDRCLDVCTGTGDLVIAIRRRLKLPAVGADFCYPMLERASVKLAAAGLRDTVCLSNADALALPFREASFGFVTIAFGLRNLESLKQGLGEMRRVLVPGGTLIVLEFSKPSLPIFRSVFRFYFTRILPRLGSWISGTRGPYHYLPDSVGRFPSPMELVRIMESAGFRNVRHSKLTAGIATLHWGRKDSL